MLTLVLSLRSYSTAAPILGPDCARLDAYASAYSRAVRTAYAWTERALRLDAPSAKAELKARIKQQSGFTSRQADAVLMDAGGKRAGILALYDMQLEDLQARISKKKGQVKRARALMAEHKQGTQVRLSQLKAQQVKTRIFKAKTAIAGYLAKVKSIKVLKEKGHTCLTFGTKKLLRQRGALEFLWHEERKEPVAAWRAAWELSRNSQFFVLVSKDQTAGCQGCVATAEKDGSFTLSVRLPDAIGGGHVVIPGLRFEYGADRLRHALAQQGVRALSRNTANLAARAAAAVEALLSPESPASAETEITEAGDDGKVKKPKKKYLLASQKDIQGGIAISWRFIGQEDGTWRIGFSTEVAVAQCVTSQLLGAIGVDLNAGFLSVAEIDRFGNVQYARDVMNVERGLSSGQRDAARGEAVKTVIALCVRTSKPLVLEELDFTKKKRDLTVRNTESKRKLSSLGYRATRDLFCARAQDAGVEVITVNPAYTSTQGLVLLATQRGWTVHQAAAGVIGRRGLGYAEVAPATGTLFVPVEGTAVECAIPEEIVQSDVSRRWPMLHLRIQQAIKLHYRGRSKKANQPVVRRGRQSETVVLGGIP